MNRAFSENLRLQLFCAVVISLLIGAIVFGLSFFGGDALLDQTVYGYSFAGQMADQQFSKLQDYVKEEGIALNNLQRLNPWCSRGEKVYLTIYHDDTLVYESYAPGDEKGGLNGQEFDPNLEDPGNEYILTLQGEVKVRAFLYYYAGDAFYFWMTAISGLLAFAAFSLCFVLLISRKVAYITRLKGELDILSGGQLEYPVTITGCDELGELAKGIDQMRRSIIRHQEIESQMRSANSELITAMSHDLRTPLTSLLAYLEIIERRKYQDERQLEELIHKSVGQTMRIKQMADQLFSYFLAYATEWEDGNMEALDADMLFHQILGDYAYALETEGLQVETDFACVSAAINVNMDLLQRALDNVYSNLLKYADPAEAIRITYKRKEQRMLLTISNIIQTGQRKEESTSLGLITCQRIIEYHKWHFTAERKENSFHVTVSIPIQK